MPCGSAPLRKQRSRALSSLRVAGGAGEDEVEGINEFKLGEDKLRRGGRKKP